jgi:hypothetical protein
MPLPKRGCSSCDSYFFVRRTGRHLGKRGLNLQSTDGKRRTQTVRRHGEKDCSPVERVMRRKTVVNFLDEIYRSATIAMTLFFDFAVATRELTLPSSWSRIKDDKRSRGATVVASSDQTEKPPGSWELAGHLPKLLYLQIQKNYKGAGCKCNRLMVQSVSEGRSHYDRIS